MICAAAAAMAHLNIGVNLTQSAFVWRGAL